MILAKRSHWKEHAEPAIEDLGPVLEKGLEATAYTAHTVGVVRCAR